MEHYKNLSSLRSNKLSSQPMSKMIAQLLVGVSIVSSLLIMYTENLNHFSSRNSLEMTLGRGMSKNCVFLICNGLLVFLVKTSGVVRSPSGAFDPNDMFQAEIGDGLETAAVVMESEPEVAVEITEVLPLEKDIAVLEEKCECEEEDDDDGSIEIKEVISETTSNLIAEIGDNENKHECCPFDNEHHFTRQEDDEGEEVHEEEEEYVEDDEEANEEEEYVDEMEKMSTEELNKKFEDFIRRMKEEFRVNNINEGTQRQHLVIVN